MPLLDVITLTNEEKTKEANSGVKEKSAEVDKKIQELTPMPLSEIRKKYNVVITINQIHPLLVSSENQFLYSDQIL